MQATDTNLLDEAAHWLARAHASDFSEDEQRELARWRNRSAQHEHVWQRAEQLRGQLNSVPRVIGKAVLERPRPARSRRQVLRAVAWALATPSLGWFAYRQLPWQSWTADYRTAKGEFRTVTLADGSLVRLNTATALKVWIDHEARRIRQLAGETLIETSHAAAYAALPFIVETDDGQMQALGTRFIVRKFDGSTLLTVLEGAVKVTTAGSGGSAVIRAGEQMRFNGHDREPVIPAAPQADAWARGILYAENMRLQDFLAELGRYREGILHCDPGVADQRVSGTYQLRDTDRILALLAQTLPVQVSRRTRYWVTVAPR
ncbi:FecR domain-containing protein [Ottowia sp. VDI28]|uniref:FecR domain-containing protein n=1 Tax=Ottowia sp. VDI28 TaxID=3133968 RepID=UPI003C2C272B